MNQKHLSLIAVAMFLPLWMAARQTNVPFNDSIPGNWSTSGSTPLSLSGEHFKTGGQSLRWQPAANDTLKAINLSIASGQISSSSHFWVYSPAVTGDTLEVQFLDNSGVVQREGHLLLNYKGWRSYHRNLRTDYDYGNTLPAFALDRFRVIYKPAGGSGTLSVYFDEVDFVGYGEARTPGPHMLLDYQHFLPNAEDAPGGNGLLSWLNTPDIPDTAAAAADLTGLAQVRAAYSRALPAVTTNEVAEAKSYVAACDIARNPDNSIYGRSLLDITIYHPDTLLMLSNHCGALARAWLQLADADARDQLLLFTEYLLDQGVAEGGRNVLLTNDYPPALGFPVGFLEALPVYTPALREEVIRMLKWSNEYNKIYASTMVPGLNVDYLYLKVPFLLELACADTSDNRAVRDLKSLRRYLAFHTRTGEGARDGLKADGTGFHHHSHYVSYLQAYNSWINAAYALKGTAFKVSQQAYDTMSFAVKSLLLEHSGGKTIANSESGRRPFPASGPVDSIAFKKLVEVGGDIKSTTIDTAMAAWHNYLFTSGYYPVPQIKGDGFYQFNYAQMGVMRWKNWTAVMRGFTDTLWGAEIYAGENRYGRYQAYGATEVLYNGQLTATGYKKNGEGWDWNVVPGATTVHLPYADLNPLPSKAAEYQLGSFAGALTLGNNGMFGFDFRQDTVAANYATSYLQFRKSVFAFDSMLVCIGTGIETGNSYGKVATNLFQALADSNVSNPAIYINSTTATAGTYNNKLAIPAGGFWLVNAQGTGFYLPSGNDSITVFRGSQTTPEHTSVTGSAQRTANVSKAWIDHGMQPAGSQYHYAIVPAFTAQKMAALAPSLAQGQVYQVLQNNNALHAIRYLPHNLNSYVFFEPQQQVNIGFVKSISGRALVGIREKGDTLIVKIAYPDLNRVSDSMSYWRSTAYAIDLVLQDEWTVLENNSGATITQGGDSLVAGFSLIHGAPATLVLLKQGANPSLPGVWTLPAGNWNYEVGMGTQGVASFTTTSRASTSPGSNSYDNFLAAPASGYARVSIGSLGTPRFDLVQTPAALQVSCSDTGTIGRFSAYHFEDALPVASQFFTITFNDSTTNKAEWTFATGYWHDTATYFSGSSGIPNPGSATSTPYVFGALKWQITTTNPGAISFQVRQKTIGTNNLFTEVNNSVFLRGGTYRMEVYSNNADTLYTYKRGIATHTVLPRTYHVWANDQQLHFGGAAGFPANELATGLALNALLLEGKNSGSLIGGMQTRDNSARLTIGHTLQVNFSGLETEEQLMNRLHLMVIKKEKDK